MNNQIQAMCAFLDASVSGFHAVDYLKNTLQEAGYTLLTEAGNWELVPGGKYMLTRNGTSLMAFRSPQAAPKGFMMTASHSDRPGFKLKEIYELFPSGPGKGACKMAGLPKPTGCV